MAGDVVIGGNQVDKSRRAFLTTATVATGAIGAALAVVPFAASWLPSERARAVGAPISIDLSKVDPGQMVVPIWRKQPIYIVRRTPAMLATLANHDDRLKDPTSASSDQPAYAKNVDRARKPEFLVLIGVCTHLGCLPKARFEAAIPELGADWPGGFFCPCHGSRFDLSGRVFDGSPASVNLRVPPYSFAGEQTLVIGVDAPDQKGAA
jgi:ubiquinol-cytochrome c reductase iron-sulfur subunit